MASQSPLTGSESTSDGPPQASGNQDETEHNSKICITGGKDLMLPPFTFNQHHNFVALAGNDTSNEALKACCAPHEVNLIEPCLLWCWLNPGTSEARFIECINDHNLAIISSFGRFSPEIGSPANVAANLEATAQLGPIAALAVVIGYWLS